MRCKRCGSNKIEIKEITPLTRALYVVVALAIILSSGLNLLFLIIGFGVLAVAFSTKKRIHCKKCGAKY